MQILPELRHLFIDVGSIKICQRFVVIMHVNLWCPDVKFVKKIIIMHVILWSWDLTVFNKYILLCIVIHILHYIII
jgi:hypothetical protein